MVRRVLEGDRVAFLDGLVMKAHKAMEVGDFRTSFGVARALGAAEAMANTAVYKKDGVLTTSRAEEIARWDEQFAGVFAGQLVPKASLQPAPPATCPPQTPIDASPVSTEAAFAALGRNKGVGPDGIPAELLQAGGALAAVIYAGINERVAASLQWPLQRCGGHIRNAWEKKGRVRHASGSSFR